MNKEPEVQRQESKLLGVGRLQGVAAKPGTSEYEDSSSRVGRSRWGLCWEIPQRRLLIELLN